MSWHDEIEKMVNTSTKLAAVEHLVSSIDIAWLKQLLQCRPAGSASLLSTVEHSDFLAARMQLVIFYAEQINELKKRYPNASKGMPPQR